MNKEKIKQEKKNRRRKKIRTRISGTKKCPRFSVFRSNVGVFLQIIDDKAGKTLVSAHSREIKKVKDTNIEFETGKLIAKKAREAKIKEIVFDRGGNKYHGRIKAVGDGAREGGLKF